MSRFTKIKGYLLYNTSTKQTIIKNTFWLLIAEGVSKGSVFLISILIARQLGPEEFGVMGFITSFVSMFIILTDFGLTTLMVREVSRDQSKLEEYFVNGNFLKVILGISTFLIVWGVSHFIGKPDFYINLILVYCGYAIINNIGEFIRSFFRPAEKMQYEAILKIINGILVIVIIGGSLYMGYGLNGIFWAYMLSGVLSLIISIIFVIGKQKIRTLKINKEIIKFSLKTGGLLLSGMLATTRFLYIDQIILGFFRTETELGYYSAAYKIIGVIVLCASLMATVLYPKMAKMNGEKRKNKEFIRSLSKLIILGSSIFIIINLCVSSLFIPLIFGQQYVNSIILYNILIFTIIFSFFNNIFGNLLIIHHKEKQYLFSVLVALIVNILLNIIFIPIFGAVAAAVTTVVTEGVCLSFYYYFSKKYIL